MNEQQLQELDDALNTIKQAIQTDAKYAMAWREILATAVFDALPNCTLLTGKNCIKVAKHSADNFLERVFDVPNINDDED
jgi:hypothetical protein